MSALTKLFVVLLVLVSIVLTAGMVTFVNRIEPLNTRLTEMTERLSTSEQLSKTRENDAATLRTQLSAAVLAGKQEAATLQTTIQTIQSQLLDREAQLTKANQNFAFLTSANASSSSALQASEDAKTKLMEQVATLRGTSDERLRQVADLGQRVTTLTAENSALEKARRNLAEQVTDLQGKVQQANGILKDMGVTTAMIEKTTPGIGAGAPAINGVIRDRRQIAGREYATISIGSSDQVSVGMEFKILDKATGDFLGILKIDVVDSNEAIGQIDASDPNKLAQIKVGNIVKTQI